MSQDLKEARKMRGSGKGWLSRSMKELQELCEDTDTSFELLDCAVSVFDEHMAAFDSLQAEVGLLLDIPADLEANIDETDRIHKDARKERARTATFLRRANNDSD
ncbi:hypothetical protein E2C01_081471 [Portunus trituberculatus]|uniref:Uncharacterized protein n=1 Tax=Portunus trituberculatus TaxID=210409 RepID=A0A5B7IYA0_PORTR|nr:hypothetical protein [Portunus trituberculatus]